MRSAGVVLLLIFTMIMVPSDSLNSAGFRPLDLPVGNFLDEDDEDAQNEVILFFDIDVEGDAFIFYIASKTSTARTDYGTLKSEVVSSIEQLSRRSQFSVVDNTGDTGETLPSRAWSETARHATGPSKNSAASWIVDLEQPELPGSDPENPWYCITEGALHSIEIASKCRARKKNILIVGDWWPRCHASSAEEIDEAWELALTDITEANTQRIPIHTVFVDNPTLSDDIGGRAVEFWSALADLNEGSYIRVEN